jgi:hypothetical protein
MDVSACYQHSDLAPALSVMGATQWNTLQDSNRKWLLDSLIYTHDIKGGSWQKGLLFAFTKLTRLSFQFRSISCTAWEEDPSTTGLPARSPRTQEHSPHSWPPTICSCPLRSVVVIHEPLCWSVLTLATLSYSPRPSSLMLLMMDGILPALKKPRPCCCFFRPGLDPRCPHRLLK